jgi:hypothetical protein
MVRVVQGYNSQRILHRICRHTGPLQHYARVHHKLLLDEDVVLTHFEVQMLGGALADQYGGKRVLAVGVALWSLFTFLTPEAAANGTVALITCRIAMGLGEVLLC